MSVEPNPFDDERLIQIRGSQEDPIVQYYIVRTDIPMTIGKVCAQIAHGAQMFAYRFMNLKEQGCLDSKIELTDKWINGSFRKVVLGGKAKDFERIKKELEVISKEFDALV